MHRCSLRKDVHSTLYMWLNMNDRIKVKVNATDPGICQSFCLQNTHKTPHCLVWWLLYKIETKQSTFESAAHILFYPLAIYPQSRATLIEFMVNRPTSVEKAWTPGNHSTVRSVPMPQWSTPRPSGISVEVMTLYSRADQMIACWCWSGDCRWSTQIWIPVPPMIHLPPV